MNIYVGNISWGLNDQDLENVFAEYGTVTSAKIITDRMTNRSRGFGFVEMSDGAEAAIEALNGTEEDGRELVVNESRPKDKSYLKLSKASTIFSCTFCTALNGLIITLKFDIFPSLFHSIMSIPLTEISSM